ncbi:MAG: M23 family metallopeptidase [Aeromicrobium erythreum]
MKTTRTCATALSAVALGLGGLAATAPASASTDGVQPLARPVLKVPFPCQQDWRGSTRPDHADSPNRAMDMNKAGTSGDGDAGLPVKASAAGTVAKASTGGGGLGNTVVINHAGGYSTLYAHLGRMSVSRGDTVSATTTIGTVGKSGLSSSTPTHLHYEQHDAPNAGHAVSIRFGTSTNALYYGERVYARTSC